MVIALFLATSFSGCQPILNFHCNKYITCMYYIYIISITCYHINTYCIPLIYQVLCKDQGTQMDETKHKEIIFQERAKRDPLPSCCEASYETVICQWHHNSWYTQHLPSSHERAEAQQNSTKKHPTQSRVGWRVRGKQQERPSIPPLPPKQNQALPGTCPRNAALGGQLTRAVAQLLLSQCGF